MQEVGAGEEVRTLQKRRTAVADRLFFLREDSEAAPFGFWKVKSLLTNEQRKGGYRCMQ